jgi:hypothetical protein
MYMYLSKCKVLIVTILLIRHFIFQLRLRRYILCWTLAVGRKQNSLTLTNPGKDSNCLPTFRLISLLSTMDKPPEKFASKSVQMHIQERGLLNPSRFGFRTRHNKKLQCMKLTDHVTRTFNKNMLTAAVFLDKILWHNLAPWPTIKIVKIRIFDELFQANSFLSARKVIVPGESELYTPRLSVR